MKEQKQKITRIPIGLYTKLYQAGGDKLVSVFCMLKSQRNGEIKYYAHKSGNNKFVSGYSLLRKQTTLSLSVLEKYVPLLVGEGVCYFDKNGDFVLLGNRKLKSVYGYKLVPIITRERLTDTAVYSMSVRAFSKESEQRSMISKKRHRSELLLQYENPPTLKIYKAAKRWKKFYEKSPNLNQELNDKVVLSNYGWAKLQNGVDGSIGKGFYHKTKLEKAGVLQTKRQFTYIKKMSLSEYKHFKANVEPSERNRYTYINSYLAEEGIATFSMVDITKKGKKEKEVNIVVQEPTNPVVETVKVNRPLPYLTLDFISWLQENKPTPTTALQ